MMTMTMILFECALYESAFVIITTYIGVLLHA